LISIVDILKKTSDDKALTLFNSIAISGGDKYIPLKEMNLSTKQYYSRISGLTDAGLIKRYKGKYSLTLLGKMVYDSQMTIGKALKYYWKLKAIESIEMSPSVILPKDDLSKIVDTLIDNQQIKDIIMKTSLSNFDATEVYGRHQQLDQQRLQQGRKEESGLEKLMLNK
jgi:DNA-binding Lrp family transcriptional regulator